jgi:hypothetical protein
MSAITAETFGSEVAAALGGRLTALLLYGSAARGTHAPGRSAGLNTLLVCDAVDEALFAALEPAVRTWTRAGNPAPLIFTEQEWRDSSDAFAIEYEEIRQAHRLLAGRDPWQGISVRREDLRRQLEFELVGKLVRLRQAYAAVRSDAKRLTELVVGSAAGFFTMLRSVLRLSGRAVPAAPAEMVREAAALVGFPRTALDDLVAHVGGRASLALAPRDPRATAYLETVARTAEFVNGLT